MATTDVIGRNGNGRSSLTMHTHVVVPLISFVGAIIGAFGVSSFLMSKEHAFNSQLIQVKNDLGQIRRSMERMVAFVDDRTSDRFTATDVTIFCLELERQNRELGVRCPPSYMHGRRQPLVTRPLLERLPDRLP